MLHQIGAGALGPVFRAYQPEPGRLVAVKLFRLDLPPEKAHKLVAEFERLIAADLSHPSIAAPLGTGLSDITPYLAQDFVTADSLDVVIRDGGSSSPSEVARVAAQFGAALDFAADRDVLHGSLHPRDVMLSADDVRITGFGITRAVEQVQISTPVRRPYSAPERAVGGPWDGRADMFSFAALMFELLFGRRISGSGEKAVTSLPEIPGTSRAALKRVFAKALSGDPGGRFTSGAAFADALQAALVQPVDVAIPSLTDGGDEAADARLRTPKSRPEKKSVEKKETGVPEEFRLDAHELQANQPTLQLPLGADDLDIATVFERDRSDLPDPVLNAPVADVSIADAVDLERHDRALDMQSADAVAAEQQMEQHADEAPSPPAKRAKKRFPSPWHRSKESGALDGSAQVQTDPASVVVPPIDAGSPTEHELARPEPAATLVPILDADPAEPRISSASLDFVEPEAAVEHAASLSMRTTRATEAEHDSSEAAADLRAVAAAASGLEHWIASAKQAHPAGIAELPTADVAADHGDSLELRRARPAPESDDDHALHGDDRDTRTGVAGFSQALESTRSALWPIVLAFVVGGAVIAGILVLVMSRDTPPVSSEAPVATDVRPAPTAIEEPAIAPSGAAVSTPPTSVPSAASTSTASATPPSPATPPVVSEPSAARAAAPAARPAPAPDRARPTSGRLIVRSTPSGARVTLDGRNAGVTPLTLPNVSLGAHAVRLQREGYTPVDRRVSTSAERPNSTVRVELTRTPTPRAARTPAAPPVRAAAPPPVAGPTTLVVESRPSGASVTLNGRAVGTTPLTLTGVAVGDFPLTLDLPGFRRWSTSVKIENGQRVRVGASLEQ